MDDFFEVLIYILFIAVSIVGGIYKNYAKKKEEEARREKQLRNAKNTIPTKTQYESKTETRTIPSSLEDFLKQQFDMKPEPVTVNDEIDQEAEYYEGEKRDYSNKEVNEGTAAFKKTSDTIISDNLYDVDFSIKSELNNQSDIAEINEEEAEAFRYTDEDEGNENNLEDFDLQQAVIFSEILKRPYQD